MRTAQTGVVIRAPNHLGDLVMALPALEMGGGADVLVARWLVPILQMAKEGGTPIGDILPIDRGWRGILRAGSHLRRRRYGRGVLLTPSFSSALVFSLGGVKERRGTPTDRRGALLTDPLPTSHVRRGHRAEGYVYLVQGTPAIRPPAPRLPVPQRERRRWFDMVPTQGAKPIGVFPGSHASSRRWPAARFRELVTRLVASRLPIVVFGSRSEMELTAEVAAGRATDLGGRTDLTLLAAGLAECCVLITNDSGPMHLAAAVGTPTISLWGPGDPEQTRPLGRGDHLLIRDELPCIPCVKNECPRSGTGYRLQEAKKECMQLIRVDYVQEAVLRHLERTTN